MGALVRAVNDHFSSCSQRGDPRGVSQFNELMSRKGKLDDEDLRSRHAKNSP
jgi:hypothetical protein